MNTRTRSRTIAGGAMLIAAMACSGNYRTANDAGADGGASDDGGASGDDATVDSGDDGSAPDAGTADGSTCSQPGASACDTVMNAVCDRSVRCCTGSCGSGCIAAACTSNACRAKYAADGWNCTDGGYARGTVCPAKTAACANDVSLMSCNDLAAGNLFWPPSCQDFWRQF